MVGSLTTIADNLNGADTPNFRTAIRPLQRRLGIPIYRKDVNMEWSVTSGPLVVYNTNATKKKIMNVLGVLLGEEFFEPTFGSLLPYRLFQPQSKTTVYQLEGDTITALQQQLKGEIYLLISQCAIAELVEGDGYAIKIAYREKLGQPIEYLSFTFNKAGVQP